MLSCEVFRVIDIGDFVHFRLPVGGRLFPLKKNLACVITLSGCRRSIDKWISWSGWRVPVAVVIACA